VTFRLQKVLLPLLLVLLVTGEAAEARAGDGVFTLWPLVDYRYSPENDFYSWKFFGPLLKYEENRAVRQRAFRPVYYRTDDLEKKSFSRDILYPVSQKKSTTSDESFQVIQLWSNYKIFEENHPEEVNYQTFTLFPLIFYGKKEGDSYFAFFPLGGTIKGYFKRDEIKFFLFPLYSRTKRDDTTIHNILWPIYAHIKGENETGTKVWPVWGGSRKTGVYKKRFFLWPLLFKYDLRLDSDNPEKVRAFFPFYLRSSSPKRSSTHVLWPFFSHIHDREKGYKEWNYPWPLFRKVEGENRYSNKYLPFYADEKSGDFRKRWFLWPIYKIEETSAADFSRRRDRVLFFLFSNMDEKQPGEPWKNKKRIAFWPFFTYEQKQGTRDFFLFSLAEPFFPENEVIARNWGPLWRIYQHRYDENRDIEVSSFLWNLYWKERRSQDLAWELFPLVRYRHEKGTKDLKILKGLFRYTTTPMKKKVSFLFLPWGFTWDNQL